MTAYTSLRAGTASSAFAVGVLGGMGPRATEHFVSEYLQAVETRLQPVRDQDYPDFIVLNLSSAPDRSESIAGDPTRLHRALLPQLERLGQLGCKNIVIPCVTAHVVVPLLPADLPLVDIRTVTATEIRNRFDECRVGVLATSGSRAADVIGAFSPWGTLVLPTDDEQNEVMDVIYSIKSSQSDKSKNASRTLEIVQRSRDRGADVVVLACTELEMMAARTGDVASDILLPLRSAANHLVQQGIA